MQAKLNELFSALSDATRREILIMLLEDDMAVTDVAHPFDMSLPAISKHLNILSNAGLITQERRGRVNWCKLEPDGLRDASVWMLSFGQFDIPDIEDLERLIESHIDLTQKNSVSYTHLRAHETPEHRVCRGLG